jgi:hypothetical protein
MDEPQIVDLLEELAESLGLQISYESIWLDEELGARPGEFCLLKGQRLVIINPRASTREKIRILSEALKHFDLSQIYIRPVLRELLDTIPEQKPPVVNGNDDRKDGDKPVDVEE